MNAPQQTTAKISADDLDSLQEGDVITVEYESNRGQAGNTQSFEAEVTDRDLNRLDADEYGRVLIGSVTLCRTVTDGPDEKANDHVPRRKLKASAGTLRVESRSTTKNGAVWNRLSRHGSLTVTAGPDEDGDSDDVDGRDALSTCLNCSTQTTDTFCEDCSHGTGDVEAGNDGADGHDVERADDDTLNEPIRIQWAGDARDKMLTRGVTPAFEDGCGWAESASHVMTEHKTVIWLQSEQDVDDFLRGLIRVRGRMPRQCTWMTAQHVRSYNRVYNEVIEKARDQGASVDASGRGVPSIEWPDGPITDCPYCSGEGYVTEDLPGGGQAAERCEQCEGNGTVEV